MKEYIGSDEHFQDSVNAHYDKQEEINKQQQKEIDYQINSQKFEFEPFGWTPLQIATYAINCPKEDKYFEEVAHMIERYADTKIRQELELPSLQQPNDTYDLEQQLSACETILEEKTTIILSAINLMKGLKLFRTLSPDAVIAISECIQIIEGLDKGQIHGTDRQT